MSVMWDVLSRDAFLLLQISNPCLGVGQNASRNYRSIFMPSSKFSTDLFGKSG